MAKNKKREILTLVLSVVLYSVIFLGIYSYADSNGIWNDAQNVLPGELGADELSGEYVFEEDLTINNRTDVKTVKSVNGSVYVVLR